MIDKLTINSIRTNLPSIPTIIIRIITPTILLLISGCASTSQYKPTTTTNASKKGGGYYLDDGPHNNPPDNLHLVLDATPKLETLRKANMRPYKVMGQSFTPMTRLEPYRKHGRASWYGRRFHGKPTATGEVYDMYAMTAAHPTLPLPSYARVTNTQNGKTIVVRVNDRGPFLAGRLIDLSYVAAYKLELIESGSGDVVVESILPEEIEKIASLQKPTVSTVTPSTADANKAAYLQFGTFTTIGRAYHYLFQIQEKLSWIDKAFGVTEKSGLFKIHVGPYPNQLLAQQAAHSVIRQINIRPLVVID